VVVAFHFEYGGDPVAHINNPGILSRSLDDPWGLCRETVEVFLAGFVAAVFTPHCREDTDLDHIRLAFQYLFDVFVFIHT